MACTGNGRGGTVYGHGCSDAAAGWQRIADHGHARVHTCKYTCGQYYTCITIAAGPCAAGDAIGEQAGQANTER